MAEQTTAEIPEIAQTVRAQIIEGLQQSQKFAFDAAQTIAKTTSTLPDAQSARPAWHDERRGGNEVHLRLRY